MFTKSLMHSFTDSVSLGFTNHRFTMSLIFKTLKFSNNINISWGPPWSCFIVWQGCCYDQWYQRWHCRQRITVGGHWFPYQLMVHNRPGSFVFIWSTDLTASPLGLGTTVSDCTSHAVTIFCPSTTCLPGETGDQCWSGAWSSFIWSWVDFCLGMDLLFGHSYASARFNKLQSSYLVFCNPY